jgi:hypothetical protein
MFATVRRYKVKGDIAEINQVVHQHLIPALARLPSFIAYYAFDAGDGVIASVSVFEDAAGAEESDNEAARVVGDNLADLDSGPPEILAGEVFAAES